MRDIQIARNIDGAARASEPDAAADPRPGSSPGSGLEAAARQRGAAATRRGTAPGHRLRSGAEREYEIAWTRALVARGLPEQAIAHYAALPAGLREADPARNAALEAHVERAGFKPLAFMTSLRGTLRATQRIYREGRVSPEQQAAAREVLARAEELTRADDAGSVLLLGGGARLICALLVTKEDPGEGAPSVLSALEYIAAARDPAVAVVAGSARATLDRIEALGEVESVDREAALLAWLEGPADE